ncbi:MAG: PDZ domain-containing protein [Acidobacteria bacterium]|nr:PDZ domain-containing protein [Acidobacteriota bacterium]
MIPILSIRISGFLTVCAILTAFIGAPPAGYTQSPADELDDALVRVNVAFEIHSAGDFLEFRRRLLDEYNPVFVQNFSATGIVPDRRDEVMAFLGVGKYFIPGHDTRYEIVTSKGRSFKGKLIGIDRGNGAAVIRIPGETLHETSVCLDCSVRDGTVVFAPVKGPAGIRYQQARILSAELNRDAQGQSAWKIRMNRPLLEERHPVFTEDRRVLGFIERDEGAWNVLHPVSEMLASAEKIVHMEGDIRTGYLGILPDDYRSGAVSGVIIKSVTAGSPAQKAGLAVSDVVLQYGGRDVLNATRFVDMVQETPVGSDVPIKVLRQGKPMVLSARIQARKLGDPIDFLLQNIRNTLNSEFADIFLTQPGQQPPRVHAIGFNAVVLTPTFADALQIRRRSGLLVYGLAQQTPAGMAGIRNGDVIVSVDEKPFSDAAEFFAYLKSLHSGSSVIMKVDRNGSERIISFRLPDLNR